MKLYSLFKSALLLVTAVFFGNIAFSQNMEENVRNQLLLKRSSGFDNVPLVSQRDLRDMVVSSAYHSPSTGFYHLYFNQRYKGIEVYNALLNIVVKQNNIAHIENQFFQKIDKLNPSTEASISPERALELAASYLKINLTATEQISTTLLPDGNITEAIFRDKSITTEDIKIKLYWLPSEDGNSVRLVWNVNIETPMTSDWWNLRFDARTGEFIEKNNWVAHCSFDRTFIPFTPENVQSARNQQMTESIAAESYTVFNIPLEAPTFGNRTVVTSPYTTFVPAGTGPGTTNGWHNDGTTSYTTTRGNNVLAQDDTDNNNNTPGNMPNSAILEYDYPYTFGPNTASGNQLAAITNLFYWNNLIHDVLYRFGFDEPSGNYQANNLGRGGAGNDFVYADAQDGGGTNNANFSAPVDGSNGRMQMYLWTGSASTSMTVNTPAIIAGSYTTYESGFSVNNKLLNPLTGDLILVDDAGTATTSFGCSPFDNAALVTGKIAVIDRGGTTPCNSFTTKVKNAQLAGAIAVIVVNNVSTTPITMGGTDNTITIPAFMISQANGNSIKSQLTAGQTVNVTLNPSTAYQPDGDFDNGIIAHEYGHGWSIRLTGGPANSGCLSNVEQGGEGWSDYLALMLTTNWANQTPTLASANVARGIGTYAISQPTTGGGIRPFPYSYNKTGINNSVTYAAVGNTSFSQPHGIGSIWCTILWDMTWEIIFQDNQIVPDIYNTSNLVGNVAALKLVNEGLRLQKCSPSFIDARNAILQADQLLFNGKYKCSIWKAFARRGVGANASTGSSTNDRTVTEDYSMPAGVEVKKDVSPLVVPEGGTVTFTLTATCGCSNTSTTITDPLPSTLTYVNGSANNGGTLSGSTVTWSNQSFLANEVRTYSFQAKTGNGTYAAPVVNLNDDFDGSTPSGTWTTTATTGTTNFVNSSTFVRSGSTSKFAANPTTSTDFKMNNSISYTLNGKGILSFWHRYNTEDGWDGGSVEISTNNGTTWIDLGPYFITNGYSGFFTGNSNGWIQSQADLSAFMGSTALIRFKMVTDANTDCGTANCGWYIDDVNLTTRSAIKNTASTSSGSTDDAVVEITNVSNPVVRAKVFLNNYDSSAGLMSDNLKDLINFPLSDPYSTMPYSTGFIHVNSGATATTNPGVLSVSGNNSIVDWVFLELRTGISGSTSVAYTRAALLQRDGDIVDMDGSSPVTFSNAPSGNYYVAVRHRSHLGFRTLGQISLNSNGNLLDFTNNSVPLNGSSPLRQVGGIFTMNGGDANFDGSVDSIDSVTWANQNGLFDDYMLNADYNLDASSDSVDTVIWELNNGNYQELD